MMATMLTTSKIVLLPVHYYLLTIGADDPSFKLSQSLALGQLLKYRFISTGG